MSEGIDVRIDLHELTALGNDLTAWPDAARGIFVEAFDEAGELLQREIRELTPTAAGALRESILAGDPVVLGDRIEETIGSPLLYAPMVELGTRPHMPPERPIREWVELKLGLRDAEAARATQAIRWKIFRRGTAAARMFVRALDANRSAVAAMFERAERRLVDWFRSRKP